MTLTQCISISTNATEEPERKVKRGTHILINSKKFRLTGKQADELNRIFNLGKYARVTRESIKPRKLLNRAGRKSNMIKGLK